LGEFQNEKTFTSMVDLPACHVASGHRQLRKQHSWANIHEQHAFLAGSFHSDSTQLHWDLGHLQPECGWNMRDSDHQHFSSRSLQLLGALHGRDISWLLAEDQPANQRANEPVHQG
jgi:hypothetical protein